MNNLDNVESCGIITSRMNQTNIARVEPAHYMNDDGDGYSHMACRYWRSFAFGTDGKCVIGTGTTAELAEQQANERLMAHERVLHLPDRERLKVLLAGHEGYGIYPAEHEEILKLMGKILLGS